MQGDASKQQRTVEQVGLEFAGMLLQHWNLGVARQRFEVLWPEVSVAASNTLGTDAGREYIALLGRMQYEFDNRYRGGTWFLVNGTGHETR